MIEIEGLHIVGPLAPGYERVLTPEALAFVSALQRRFGPAREDLLATRASRRERLRAGELPGFLPETAAVRASDWQVARAPEDLQDRRVEITGPTDRKMLINALNSGAKVFMADLEDATSPTWANVVEGQANLQEAVRRTLRLETPDKVYALHAETATLVVRPRGWHLQEKHVRLDGKPISASLFDFGLYFFHNARYLIEHRSGPYFYLPKLESHLEARLWNDVFVFAQDALGIEQGSIRATVLIETILAAFEMEEILFELRDHAAGLNAGRWDYIFSMIKQLGHRPDMVLPDRAKVTMAVPFMRAYAQLLVKSCHAHGAHAIGGMAAFIPSRKDPEVNARALVRVQEDKERESADGFDGTWVAHPDLVPVARACFDQVLGDAPHQKHVMRPDVAVAAEQLLDVTIGGAGVTEAGVRTNVEVALRYLAAWLAGQGAVAIHNLMEDAATAEISRAQLWQWLRHAVPLDDGQPLTAARLERIWDEELAELDVRKDGAYTRAAELLRHLVFQEAFTEFLTLPAYEALP
ncbi:MAG: malate synthase [Cyanobacteria bacterium RYN_339]|nr:malate synthase [Cyanobacteria bacterium RYN_339]